MSRRKTLGVLQADVDALMRARRQQLVAEAVRIYGETHNLRTTAAQLGVSHETVRLLLKEAKREGA